MEIESLPKKNYKHSYSEDPKCKNNKNAERNKKRKKEREKKKKKWRCKLKPTQAASGSVTQAAQPKKRDPGRPR